MDFDGNAILEPNLFGSLVLDHWRKHGGVAQHAGNKPLDMARLGAILGNDHDRADFARAEIRLPVAEAGQEHGNDGKHKALTAAPADHKPRLLQRARGRDLAAGVALEKQFLIVDERQTEQGGKEDAPSRPTFGAEVPAKHGRIVDGANDVCHAAGSSWAMYCSSDITGFARRSRPRLSKILRKALDVRW